MSIRHSHGTLIPVLVLVLATACATDRSAGPPIDPTDEPSASAPATEGTDHETPATGGTKTKAIEIAGAPIGDGGTDENEDGSRCVRVQWLGGQDDANLGAGIAFRVTSVRLTNAKAGNFSCGGQRCKGFTFASNADACRQAVRRGDGEGTLSLKGRILCSASPKECTDFQSRLRPGEISIPASERGGKEPDGQTETDEPTPTAEPTETEPEPATPDEQPPRPQ
jgi:hypothetical protein